MPQYDHPPEVLNSTKRFFVAKEAENLGEFSLADLLENLYQNIFAFDHLYFREGLTEWVSLEVIYPEILVTPSQLKAQAQHKMMSEQTPWRFKQIIEKQKKKLGELKKKPGEYKKIQNEILEEIKKLKARIPKDADDDFERNCEIGRLEGELEFLSATHEARDSEYTKEEISEMRQDIKQTEEVRRMFWASTFKDNLKEPNKKEAADILKIYRMRIKQIITGWTPRLDMYSYFDLFHSPAGRSLFSGFGQKMKAPTEKQIKDTLEGLDDLDIDWENKDNTLFHRTLEVWFPDLKK